MKDASPPNTRRCGLFPSSTSWRRDGVSRLAALGLLALLAGAGGNATAQCTGVTSSPGIGLTSADFGPVVVTQAMYSDGVTPAPLNVGDCSGDGFPDLEIPWSGAGANPPATFSFSAACPDGADYVIVTFSGSATTWTAHDGLRQVINSASFPAGVQITMNLGGPRIDTLTVTGVDLCVHQVCWECEPTSAPLTLDFEGLRSGTLITDQFQPQGVLFGFVRSPVRIVSIAGPGTQSGKQALEVVYGGDPPQHAGPMQFRFLAPQRRVGVHVGQHYGRNPTKSEAVLRVFDSSGRLLGNEYAAIGAGPGSITEVIEVDVGRSVIERAEVHFIQRQLAGNVESEVDTGGVETIDDLSFEGTPPPPDPPLPGKATCVRSRRGVGLYGVEASGECGDYLTLSFSSGDAGKLLTSAVFDAVTADLGSVRFDAWGSPCGWIEPAAVAGHGGEDTQTLAVSFAGFAAETEVVLQVDLDRDAATGGTVLASELQGATVTATFSDGEIVTATYGIIEDAFTITADSCAPLQLDWQRLREEIARQIAPLRGWIADALASGAMTRDAAVALDAQVDTVEASLAAVEPDAGPDRLRQGLDALAIEASRLDALAEQLLERKLIAAGTAYLLRAQAGRIIELVAEAAESLLTEVCDGRDNDGDGRIDEGQDRDADRVPDCRDNCPDHPNPLQEDADQDRIGDACQSNPPRELCDGADNDDDGLVDEGFDRDLDGVRDCDDNCPQNHNPLQQDDDGDGMGNACEAQEVFVRGDASSDRTVNITDAIKVLNFLFLGDPGPRCLDAADADDDGRINITDAIRILGFLFLGDERPPAPFPAPGADSTADALPCGPAPIDPRRTKAVARVQLQSQLGLNRLTLLSGGKPAAASEVEGQLELRLEPNETADCGQRAPCPAVLRVAALHLRARSLELGEGSGEVGRMTLRLDRTKGQEGTYDPDTGALTADIPLEVVYAGLLKFPEHVTREGDLRGVPRPLPAQARIAGQVHPGGIVEARLSIALLEEAAAINGMDILIDFTGPWTIDSTALDPGFELGGDVFRLKIGVVADDASGTNAVLTSDQVNEAIREANELWSQCCIAFMSYGGGADGVSYIPAGAFSAGDGDLFEVEDGGFLPSPEQDYLFDYGAIPEAIEVVFCERFVIEGVNTFTAGVTRGIGDAEAAIIVEGENYSPVGTGYILAHELGHALGLLHSDLTGNLMAAWVSNGGPDLTEEQCAEAESESPLPRLGYACTTP